MLRAGQSGSTYVSHAHVMQELASGSASIADEAGTMKIGSAYTGDDETHIESPYSQKSIQDFHDNIISIQNAHMGGIEEINRDPSKSLHNYIQTTNPALDTRVTNAITNALAKIDAMPRPLVIGIHAPQNAQAIQACTDLADAMTALQAHLASQEQPPATCDQYATHMRPICDKIANTAQYCSIMPKTAQKQKNKKKHTESKKKHNFASRKQTRKHMETTIYRPSTLSELARCYSVDRKTLRRWLQILGLYKDSRATGRRLYTPQEISRIVAALGMPQIQLTIQPTPKPRRK